MTWLPKISVAVAAAVAAAVVVAGVESVDSRPKKRH